MMKRLPIALAVALIATPAFAQNVDFDAAAQSGLLPLAYGIGAKTVVMVVLSWLGIYGFTHERLLIALFAGIGAILYFGSAVVLGRAGIV